MLGKFQTCEPVNLLMNDRNLQVSNLSGEAANWEQETISRHKNYISTYINNK